MEVPGSLFFSLMHISVCEEPFPFEELEFFIFSTQNYLIFLPPIAPYTKPSIKHAASSRLKKPNQTSRSEDSRHVCLFFLKNTFEIAFPNRLVSEYFSVLKCTEDFSLPCY